MGIFDLEKTKYTGTKKNPTYNELYEEIQSEEDELQTENSPDLPAPEAIRSKVSGSRSSIVNKLKKIGIDLDRFNYPNSMFDKLKLLKCLYRYDKQNNHKLFMILQKASLQNVDNSVLEGTEYNNLNFPNKYGSIIHKFKNEIESQITIQAADKMKKNLINSICNIQNNLVMVESTSFWKSEVKTTCFKQQLSNIKTFISENPPLQNKDTNYTVFEAMYFKTIIAENMDRERDLLRMRPIFDEFDKLNEIKKPIKFDSNPNKAVDINYMENYICKNINDITYMLKGSQPSTDDIESLKYVSQHLPLILHWLNVHQLRSTIAYDIPKYIPIVCIVAYLQVLWILNKHKEIKLCYRYYGWKPDTGSLYSKLKQGDSLPEFYQLLFTCLMRHNERRWIWGVEATKLFNEFENLIDNIILNLLEAKSAKDLNDYYTKTQKELLIFCLSIQ